ncbi:Ig-like domain-containing protein [Escherichia coli]|uniref:Ig-like domain-containing protein n=1 Tax=Escherichia coli TaxID=562 RepID=UPI00388F126D
MAILDDVIGVFSPGWKAARLRSRAVIQAYEAVKTTRTHKARRENRTADQLSQYGAVSLREQARYLDNNHDLVTGLTVSPASASVKVGATTTLTFTVKPDGASDKAISVHSSDPQTATVTLNGLVATVKGVKQGSVSIVGMTADGNFVAVAAVTVSAAG